MESPINPDDEKVKKAKKLFDKIGKILNSTNEYKADLFKELKQKKLKWSITITKGMRIVNNSRMSGKSYKEFKSFMENLEKVKIGGSMMIVTPKKTITLIKQKETIEIV